MLSPPRLWLIEQWVLRGDSARPEVTRLPEGPVPTLRLRDLDSVPLGSPKLGPHVSSQTRAGPVRTAWPCSPATWGPRVSHPPPRWAHSEASGVKSRLLYGKPRVSPAMNSLKNLSNVPTSCS